MTAEATIELPENYYRVMLVDKHPMNIAPIRKLLERHEFRFEAVPNGDIALRTLEWFQPDLVLLNPELPGLNGRTLLRQLRRRTLYAQLPLLALTKESTAFDTEKAVAAGFTNCISKPSEASEFLSSLRAFLEAPQHEQPFDAAFKGPYLQRALDEFRSLANSQLENLQAQPLEAPEIRKVLKQLSAAATFLSWSRLSLEFAAAECLVIKTNQPEFNHQIQRCCRILAYEITHTALPPDVKAEPTPEWIAKFSHLKSNYLKRLSSGIIALREAVSKGDFEQIRIIGHNLKGSGTAYEFPQITEYGRGLEAMSRTSDTDGICATVGNLSTYLDSFEMP